MLTDTVLAAARALAAVEDRDRDGWESTAHHRRAALDATREVLRAIRAHDATAPRATAFDPLQSLVAGFGAALLDKLRAAEQKYGYSDAWSEPANIDAMRADMLRHIEKGDPRDVAAYCAFLWHHGASTTTAPPAIAPVVRRIYLDCDGVLADFDRHFTSEFGIAPRGYESIHGEATFWRDLEHLQPPFFRSLPLMPDARALFDAVAHLRPLILTGCPRGGWAEPQKLAWGAEAFPGTPMIVCAARNKRDYCRPGDILIDDRSKYRDRWEAAGGVFVHHTSARESIAALASLGLEIAA